ncbi:MAG: chemotaxis protein CheW [Gammaproteobacteria bacterium]|nr:chemotaxis protein CheW [Gammaproteobacteria bacterium]
MLARYGQPEPAAVPRSAASQLKSSSAPHTSSVTTVREPQPVAKLLEQVSAVQREILPQRQQPQPVVEELANLQCILETSGLTDLAGDIIPPVKADVMMAEDEFQTLYFEVAGLVLAVPLRMLGGIHRLERINKLIGKPDWYMGMMLQRDAQLHVVDTARWVMPEKYTPDLAASLNYQYLIMLDDSPWGLACERLLTAATVRKDAVRWRERNGKRPWLAGLVIERMCALIDVSALIAQLRSGGER